MIKGILSIAGRPGLYKLVQSGRGSLIVEQLSTGKRLPVQQRDRVISLADVAMYTDGDDVPLGEVLTSLYNVAEGKEVDVKTVETEGLREFFAKVLPTYDRDRVHISDIRKLLSWYNVLVAAGITDFSNPEPEAETATEE
ncbi:MAG: DUF5606 domain-containing protein [Muribaculaceae bacterium]|nr:DUF5606 domain-containing protein [Bacteroidales bacterium]MBD5325491.1 DUF5606 domain-containing protein [Bacteroides sp.]MBD5327135.1 DUF5606 domain-containing protein [Bacteroides sp.]MDE6223011.1 DUF5606 domain-containing protein [Muribaculaceae bacterium]MDE6228452.1 DUF5606 domain-containing protein [Muribaculaceae bacterium]